jgi:transposase-like protein
MTQGGEGAPTSEVVRLAVKRIVEEALEAEARDRLGRGYYERRGRKRGYRNGYRTGRLRTAEGMVEYSAPQISDLDEGFRSAVRKQLGRRSNELEQLGLEMYARGLSTRDIEAVFRGEDGETLLSRSSVSELTEALWNEYEAFATRDLSDIEPLYLFLDGIAERLRVSAPREAILCAWAITRSGKKVLVHLAPGSKESTDCVRDFLQDLKRRGLGDPVLVATDGAPGLIRAVEECFPVSLRQRCLAHRVRNIVGKLPEHARGTFKEAAVAAYQAPSLAMARALREQVVASFGAEFPAATACFDDDFEACIAHLHCPPTHRRLVRTTNLLERLFVEERRRLRAAHTIVGERAVLKLMYASLIRASSTWRPKTITEFETRQLDALQDQLRRTYEERHRPVVRPQPKTGAPPARISSTKRT